MVKVNIKIPPNIPTFGGILILAPCQNRLSDQALPLFGRMDAVGAEEGDRVPNVEKRGADVEQTALALPRNA